MTRLWSSAKNKGSKGEQLLVEAISQCRPNHDFANVGDRKTDLRSPTLGVIEVKSEGVKDVIRKEEAMARSDFPPAYTNPIKQGFPYNGQLVRRYMLACVQRKDGESAGVFKTFDENKNSPALFCKQFFRQRLLGPIGRSVKHFEEQRLFFEVSQLREELKTMINEAIGEFEHNYNVKKSGKGVEKPIRVLQHGIQNLWHGKRCPHEELGEEHDIHAKPKTSEMRVRIDLQVLFDRLRRHGRRQPTMCVETAIKFLEMQRGPPPRPATPAPPPSSPSPSATPSSQRSYSPVPTEEDSLSVKTL